MSGRLPSLVEATRIQSSPPSRWAAIRLSTYGARPSAMASKAMPTCRAVATQHGLPVGRLTAASSPVDPALRCVLDLAARDPSSSRSSSARRSPWPPGPRPGRRAGRDLVGHLPPAVPDLEADRSRVISPTPAPGGGRRRRVAAVQRRVGLRDQAEQQGHRRGRVQVVVHVGPERVQHVSSAGSHVGQVRHPPGQARRAGRARPPPWSPCRGSPRPASGSGPAAPAAGRRAGRADSTRSSRVVKLPSDLDIFSPPTSTKPLCTQWRANVPAQRPPPGPARSRGGGRPGPGRRRGCRSRRPAGRAT